MKLRHMGRVTGVALVLSVVITLLQGGLAWSEEPAKAPPRVAGYLSTKDLPDSLVLVPAPAVKGTAASALDEAVSRKALALRGSPSWKLAIEDADLTFPKAANAFSCALNISVTEQDTPKLYLLMRRSFVDAAAATFAAKDKYNRLRPFVINKEPTCTPAEEERMAKNGSYPSGHATVGWAWALILSEAAPERADLILARGRAFAQGRVVCNVHWQSDVMEGMTVAAAAVAKLHSNPAFRADLEAAKGEVAGALKKGLKPAHDCAIEAAAETVRVTQLP